MTNIYQTAKLTKGIAEGLLSEGEDGNVCLFFPDAGSSALVSRDWKIGTNTSIVPSEVVRITALGTRESVKEQDKVQVYSKFYAPYPVGRSSSW